MQRKAQGLSLNTIVIAAIVLIVLVVVITLFYRSTGDFDSDIQSAAESKCETPLIQRSKETGCRSDEKKIYESFGTEFNKDKVCCRKSGKCLPPNECEETLNCDSRRELLNFKCGTGEVCCGPES